MEEALYALREKSTRRPKAGGYVASDLIRKAYELRLDLGMYEDEEWLEKMHGRGPGCTSCRAAVRLANA
jgi:hypothetical protein